MYSLNGMDKKLCMPVVKEEQISCNTGKLYDYVI